MIVAVCGESVGKSSLINRITTGAFSVRYVPTMFTEIHKISMCGRPIALVETKDVIKCDVALIVCRQQCDVFELYKSYATVSTLMPVVVRVGEHLQQEEQMFPGVHSVSNLTASGITELICCIYMKSFHL